MDIKYRIEHGASGDGDSRVVKVLARDLVEARLKARNASRRQGLGLAYAVAYREDQDAPGGEVTIGHICYANGLKDHVEGQIK